MIASKSPESEYFSLRLEAQQSLDKDNMFQQSFLAGPADQCLPSVASNEVAETQQRDTDRKRLQGLGLYVLSTLLLSLQATTAKVLGKRGVSMSVMVMARSLAILFGAVVPVMHKRPSNLWGSKHAMLVIRGLCSFTSISLLYCSVQLMPLSDSVVLQFLSPMMVALAAPLLLNEMPSRLIWMCVPLCVVGVLLVAQPTGLFGGSSASTIGATGLTVGITQLMYLGSISVLGSVVLLVITQHRTFPTTMPELVLLLLTGCAAYGSQLSQTLALKLVEASLATAMSYLSVVWGMLSGYLVFHEISGTNQEGSSYTTFKPPHKKKLQRHMLFAAK
ncbi:TPA: hypothetical protein ACH3X2_002157 [Trebouxia sp. C0005]